MNMRITSVALAFVMVSTCMLVLVDVSVPDMGDVLAEPQYEPGSFAISQGGIKYSADYISESEIDTMKENLGVRIPGKNYNVLIGENGTGLAPPTEKGWERMEDIPIIRGLESTELELAPSVDLSTDPCFPAVGNQFSQGSCSAWAMSYYAYGYQEAVDNDWTEASIGNFSQLISPAWTFNMVNGGEDHGSWMYENAHVIEDWGGCTMEEMPYNSGDCISWGTEDAWRNAPLHRASQWYMIDYQENTTIDTIKALVSSGIPVDFCIDAYQYLIYDNGTYAVSAHEYDSNSLNHAQAIVGYNDSIVEDGEVGAFRVVNSWGSGFGDNGYYWITYDCIKEIGSKELLYATCIIDEPDHMPSLLATWEFSDTPSRNSTFDFGVGTYPSLTNKSGWYYHNNFGVDYEFPEFMCMDISDFRDDYDAGARKFYMNMDESTKVGAISSFNVERYDDIYVPGYPNYMTPESLYVPEVTPGTVYADVPLVRNIDKETLHTTIQKAVDNASAGDTIWAPSGTYFENVQVPITLTIEGQRMEDTIIDASGLGCPMEIITNLVNISGFNFTNSGSGSGDAGLKLLGADDCSIIGNEFNSNHNGIILESSNNNLIYHNNIINNTNPASDDGTNQWDNGYPSGGNYWSHLFNIVHQVNNESYFASDGVMGFYLGDSELQPNFVEITAIHEMRNIWEDDWSIVMVMIEGLDHALNQSTGWIDVLWAPLVIGENFFTNYTSLSSAPDSFNGPGQDIPGADGISDISYGIPGGSNEDYYPLMEPTIDGRVGRSPIRIDSNADFDAAHGVSAGDGSEADPWIVQGWDIDGTGFGYCIYVGNVTDHFVIMDCELYSATKVRQWPYFPCSSIVLFNATNGYVHDNLLHDNEWYGICLDSSSNNTISGNSAYLNWVGIHLDNSSYNDILDNHVYLNSDSGMWIYYSNDNNFARNSIEKNDQGIYFEASSDNLVEENICQNSTAYEGISLKIGSDNNVFANNSLINNRNHGISLWGSDGNLIWNNTCQGNGHDGIYESSSTGNDIIENIIYGNHGGITIDGSVGSDVLDNDVSGNTHTGISLGNSEFIFLEGNLMTANGIHIEGSQLSHWNTHSISSANLVNGKSVLYCKDMDGAVIPADMGQIILANCTGTIVENQNVSGVDVGISLGFSWGNIIQNNTASHNNDNGILLHHSLDNIILNNTASYNGFNGILLLDSDNNSVDENECSYNECGIRLEDSDNNLVTANLISANQERTFTFPPAGDGHSVYIGLQGKPEPMTDTLSSGPTPVMSSSSKNPKPLLDYEVVIPDVPAYLWYNGCGPTSAGMVMGYWDGIGFDKLVEGDASTQTDQVNKMISSQENWDDYCVPMDSYSEILPDRSELPDGDEHSDNSIADFLMTSQSYYDNPYGWSFNRHSPFAYSGYLEYAAPEYKFELQRKYWGNFTWEDFCAEIDAGRPVEMVVDTSANGYTDHAIVAIGYGEQDGVPMYTCLNTWDTSPVHWFEFKEIAAGQAFGICEVMFFSMEKSGHGIYLTDSNDNDIFHNNIINNTIQAHDDGLNQWDRGYPGGGNYWSGLIEGQAIFNVANESFFSTGGEEGFFLQNNYLAPNFIEMDTVYEIRYVWDNDWSFIYTLEEGIDYDINITTGWVQLYWGGLVIGDQLYTNYSYHSIIYVPYIPVDNFSGPAQDISGPDSLGDSPYFINSQTQDNYPLTGLFVYSRYNIVLNEGWNLISLPFIVNDPTIGGALSDIDGKWSRAFTYDPTLNNPWIPYSIYRPDTLMNTITPLSGIWVNITEPGVTLHLKGYKLGRTSMTLHAGWNLVGYPTLNESTMVANAFWGTGTDRVEVCDLAEPGLIKEVGASYVMRPGEGYWVHVPVDSVWTIDW